MLMKEWFRTAETLMVLLILAVGFYPVVSDAWNSWVASRMITHYEAKSRDHAGRQMETFTDENGVMGYLEIPSISVFLPIYEGTSDEVLAKGVGHSPASSPPIGGTNTHTVLTGHRGLPSAKLFTDLDKVKEGDQFIIHTSGETLVYEVMDIRTVLPYETESLSVVEGEDLATLVTCTPYGVNTHRLLVTGFRISVVNDSDYEDWDVRSLLGAASGRDVVKLKSLLILSAAAVVLAGTVCRILWIWLLDWPRKKRHIRWMKGFEMRR